MFWCGEPFDKIKSMCLVDYANYLDKGNEIDEAIVHYKKAIKLDPRNYYAYGGLSAALITKRHFREALEYCNKAITFKPHVILFVLQSIIYKCLEQPPMAEEALEKTLPFFNNKRDAAYDRLAYTYRGFKMYDEAEYYLKEALRINPTEAGLHFNLARVYSKKNQRQMAKSEFQKVLELSSQNRRNLKRYRNYAKKEIERITKTETGQIA
jgi:tetratricopeptide (TPR) repeat protein